MPNLLLIPSCEFFILDSVVFVSRTSIFSVFKFLLSFLMFQLALSLSSDGLLTCMFSWVHWYWFKGDPLQISGVLYVDLSPSLYSVLWILAAWSSWSLSLISSTQGVRWAQPGCPVPMVQPGVLQVVWLGIVGLNLCVSYLSQIPLLHRLVSSVLSTTVLCCSVVLSVVSTVSEGKANLASVTLCWLEAEVLIFLWMSLLCQLCFAIPVMDLLTVPSER